MSRITIFPHNNNFYTFWHFVVKSKVKSSNRLQIKISNSFTLFSPLFAAFWQWHVCLFIFQLMSGHNWYWEVTTTSFSATKERKTRILSFPAKMKLKIVKNQLMTKKKWKVNVELWKTWMKIVKENEEKPFGVSSSIEVKWRFWRRFYCFLDQVRRNFFFIFQSKYNE